MQIKVLCKNNCDSCYNKSFASDERAIYWSKKNKLTPRQVFKNSTIKIWFYCIECDDDFDCAPHYITQGNTWCSICTHKTEKKFKKWFEKTFKQYKLKYQSKYDWCINKDTNKLLPFDFSIDEIKLIIEIDGPQHFKQISNWGKCEDIQYRDLFKMLKALNNGYSIIRIYQDDIWKDKYNWKDDINNKIKIYDNPTIKFLSNDLDRYNYYKSMLRTCHFKITFKNILKIHLTNIILKYVNLNLLL